MTPFRVSLIFVIVALVGFAGTRLLEINFTPKKVSNSFIVSFSTGQNDSPLVTETKITSLLEGVLSTIPGVRKINSVSRYGSGYVSISFEDLDIQQKRLEITTALRQIKKELPEEMAFPTVTLGESELDNQPLLIYSLTSSLPIGEIETLARDRIIPQIGLNPGVKGIRLSTDSRPVAKLTYDIDQLNALGIQPRNLEQMLIASSISEQIGSISRSGKTRNVFVNTTPTSIEQLLNLQLTKETKLGDVARIKMTNQKPSFISRLNGENTLLIRIVGHDHENKPVLAQELKDEIREVQKSLTNAALELNYDDSEFVVKELNKIAERASLSIVILSLLVLAVYRRFNQLILLIGSVLVAIGLTALLLFLLRIPIHLYTIAGLTISFGLIIDNSIMVIDHIRKRGNLKIIPALIAATLTTIAALLVIFTLPKEELNGLDDFSTAISIALGSSIVVSLLFTPQLSKMLVFRSVDSASSLTFRRRSALIRRIYSRTILSLGRYKKLVVLLMVLLFGLPMYLIPKNIEGAPWYNATVGSDTYQDKIRPITDKILGGTLRSFYLNVFERSGYRTPEKTKLYVNASLSHGHTIEQMDQVVRRVEDYLKPIGGLSAFRTNIYSGRYAQITIEFDQEEENRSLPYVLKNRLISRSLDWGGVDWNIYGVGRGFSNATGESLPAFRVKLKGYNYAELESLASSIGDKLLLHPRIKEVNLNDKISYQDETTKQLVLRPNNRFESDLFQNNIEYVRGASLGIYPTTYLEVNNRNVPVYFENKSANQFSIYPLLNHGNSVSFNHLGELRTEVKSSSLYRENRQYIRVVSFEYYGSYRFGDEFLKKTLTEFEFPQGYSYDRLQYQWGKNKVVRQYSLILFILVLIFVICASTFENLRLPLNIILIIPLSFIGIFLTFIWGEFYFDQGGYAAFILLAGITVNAAIFIVNEARLMKGNNWNRALINACGRKFTPVLLTILSTCFGLIPFLLEGQTKVFWFSFSIGVIGGLIFSIFLVFMVFPVMLVKDNGRAI